MVRLADSKRLPGPIELKERGCSDAAEFYDSLSKDGESWDDWLSMISNSVLEGEDEERNNSSHADFSWNLKQFLCLVYARSIAVA